MNARAAAGGGDGGRNPAAARAPAESSRRARIVRKKFARGLEYPPSCLFAAEEVFPDERDE